MSTAQGTAPEESVRRRGTSPALIAVLVIFVWIATTWGSQLLTGATTGWRAPSTEDFQFEGWFGTTWFTKPLLLALVAFVGILAFWLIAAHRLRVVPTRGQFFAEYVYDFVRDIGRDMIGPGYRRFVPCLLTVFCFVLVSNWFGETFLFMFPTFSRVGYAYAAAILTFAAYVVSGFKQHGLGYLRVAMLPSGVPAWLVPVIIPIEFISTFLTRPLTLSVRLFANMFAGHMSIMVFVGGGAALLTWAHSVFYNVTGVVTLLFGVLMLCLELFIGFLQAYIFAMLTAQYIGSSVGEAH